MQNGEAELSNCIFGTEIFFFLFIESHLKSPTTVLKIFSDWKADIILFLWTCRVQEKDFYAVSINPSMISNRSYNITYLDRWCLDKNNNLNAEGSKALFLGNV